MDLPFLYIVDGVIILSIFYACFCVKPIEIKEISINTPLKNNEITYDECDIEALYN